MRNIILLAVRVISFVLGYFFSLSFIRASSRPFNWYVSRIYGNWFNFGFEVSIALLIICMLVFTMSIIFAKPTKIRFPLRCADFFVLVLVCYVVFFLCFTTLAQTPSQFYLHALSIIAYISAMLPMGEFLARSRDKTLFSTLYWIKFFAVYPIYRLIGLPAMLLLASQLSLLMLSGFIPIQLMALFVICVATYFAVFLLNLSSEYSAKYEQANEERIRAERFKSELITNVSHDIRTPLTSIINYVDLLKNEDLCGQTAEYVQILDKKSARLKALIDDLMEASKAGTGNVRVEFEEINLGEIVGQAAGEFEDKFIESKLTIVFRQPDTPVLVKADSRHLYRVLENIFSNAAKYALGGTRVFSEITICGDRVLYTLQNTARDHIELSDGELTEQFIRGDKARQTEGNGLGLYIAKSLIELMGGTLQIGIIGDLFRVELTM